MEYSWMTRVQNPGEKHVSAVRYAKGASFPKDEKMLEVSIIRRGLDFKRL